MQSLAGCATISLRHRVLQDLFPWRAASGDQGDRGGAWQAKSAAGLAIFGFQKKCKTHGFLQSLVVFFLAFAL